MAAFCVNTHSKLFKDTAKKLDISEDQLELIAYKYGNQGETFGKFPSDEYILSSLQGKQDVNASESQVELWNLRYSQPRVFETIEEANQFIQDTQEYFDKDSIVLTTTNDGKFRVSVAKPKTENDFLWRGIPGKPIIDADGNLVLRAGYDNLFKGYGISFATREGPAYQYGRRGSMNPYVLKIDKDIIDSFYPFDENGGTQSIGRRVIGDEYGEEGSYEERVIMSSAKDQIVIPKGKYSIEHESVNTEGMTPADIAEAYITAFDEANVADEIVFSRVEGHSSFNDADEYFDALVEKTGSEQNAYLVLAAVQYYTSYTTTDRFEELLDSEHKKEFDSLFDEFQADEWGNFDIAPNKKFYELTKTSPKSKKASWSLDENGDLPFQKSSDTGNVTNLPDQMTADEVYQRLSQQYSPDSSEAKLSKLVFSVLQQTGIQFRAADLPEDVRGRFSASDNVIYFNRQGILSNTLLHEAIHAVSIYYMKAVNKEGFSKEVQIACKEIEECYELLKQDMLDRKVPISSIYGMTSATELVAEITRPEVVSLIRDYDARHKGQNIFQKLVNAIAKFFGINKTYGSLEKTLKDALVTLIENPNAQLMRRYALENRTAKENWNILRERSTEWSKSSKYREIIEAAAERAQEDGRAEITVSKQDIMDGVAFRIPENVSGGIISDSPIGTVFVSIQKRGAFDTGEEIPFFFTIDGAYRVDGDNVTLPIRFISLEWLSTNQFNVQTAQNGMPYITDIMPLFSSIAESSQQSQAFTKSSTDADIRNKVLSEPNDRSKFKYTRINKAFKDTLLEHLKKDSNLGDYGYSAPKRRALIDMTNALFDYFDREGYRIVITNNPIDSTGRGSAVTSFGKTVAIYYQDSPAQGGKYLSIVHELLHVATNQAISFDSMGRDIADERLSAYYNLFVAKLNEDAEYSKYKGLILNAKSYEELDEKVPLRYQILDHAAESPGEFISMCVSNAEVQRTLESIIWADVNAPKEGSLFQEIVRYLKDIISRIFRGSSYLSHVDFLDTVTEFLVDTRFVGEREQMFRTAEPEEYAKEQERWNQIWENATEFGTTISKQQAPQQQGPINIWAGSNENADLSNMAQRPFTFADPLYTNGTIRQFNSVEQAFQAYKLKYAPMDLADAENILDAINSGSPFEARRIGNTIRSLDRARWDADKFGIIKELIKASFQQNPRALQRLLATGDAVFTHNQETSIWKTEFPRILMEVRSELRSEQNAQPTQSTETEPLLAPPSVEREFHTKEVDLVTKIDNLFSGDIDASEISAEANKAVDWISDQLTQYMEDHELVYEKFFKDNPSSPSKEEVMKKLDNVSSRKEMLETVGLDKMIEFYKEEVLSMTDENADIFDNMDDAELDKYDAIKDNIEGLIQLGYSRFLGREGFGFTISDVEGETFSVAEERSKEDQTNPDDFNGQADIDGNEEVRNQQEHWQIENATRDIMDNASAKVKQAIADCYILEDNGKVDENGNKKYDIARDNLNRNERVVPIQAVRSIVKWTQGAVKLSQMVSKLESRLGTDPWISQIVTRLKDTTGNEADFQSQFFNTFCKHFQPYSIVKRRADGTFYTMVVNAHPALNDALNALSIQYKTGTFPLVNEEGVVQMSNVENLAYLRDSLQGQGNLSEENRSDVVEIIGRILETIGMPQPSDAINRILTNTLKDLVWANTKNIVEKLTAAADERGYNPLQYTGNKNGIRSYLSNILRPFTNQLEDTLVSSVFDSGKMYQSYITPSWTTKLFTKMHLPDKEFKQFILNEFGQSEWFIDSDALTDLATLDEQGKLNYLQDNPNIWRLPWVGELMRMSEADRQKAFNHKVQLNFNKQNYMRGMNDLEYVMSVYTEYFAESSDAEKGVLFGNYRFPMISNKPSNEFIRFIRHTGIDGRIEILEGLTKIFHQELSRIQTVEMRNLKEGDAGFIANFDANEGKGKGLQFNFLDYLNEYLNGSKSDTALGKLIDRKLHATEANQLTSDELTELDRLVQKEITSHLDGLADRLISQYKQNGLFEALKGIEHIGKTDAAVEDAIREFAWNDNYAEANILEMLVTDKAFYKNEEDLQKRLAQVHSPGIRGNWEATDFEGKPVSDGKVRALKLADYAGIVSDTIDNVEAVFDKKIAENPNDHDGWKALKESVLAAYRDINVVDGQAFVSPTAYRKKAIAFGEWTKDDEDVYNALLQGKANLAQIKRVFNPRKPFTYGKVNKSVNAGLGTPIKTLNYGVQYKNSEYLLIMADALLRGQETGRPNLLGALFDVMEESAKSNPTRGIDFVVFESGVKTGLTGAISINEFIDDPNGREKAFTKLWNSAFREDGSYNEDFIDVLDAEDYTTQQTVPEHFFLHGGLQWGSQIRAMATSDLETTFNGEPVLYEYVNTLTGKTIPMDARTIRDEWERNTAAYIQKGIDELSEELGLNDNMSIADRNILISKLLQREILSNQRYGVDLLLACSVDENGNFRIPLGDPIQSKRIEQLLNSIVKNRINKQKVEGGNLVEVTNFGTSKKLEIRYKDKDGNLLTSKRDYLSQGHTEEEFKQYLKENQYGIAYHECYAPAWAREVFQKFADEKGSVDVEAIRMLSPDLLKMFGYRIPTEDKYSTAPYMIVGFLPQEAGDGFMQPWETTVIDGSDFDVDKKNLMRMVLDLKSKLLSKREFLEKEGLTENDESTEKYKKYRRQAVSAKTIYDKLGDKADVSLSEEERREAEWYEKSRYKRDRKALKNERNARNEQAEDAFERRYRENGLDKLDAAIQELENKEDLTAAEEEKLAEYKQDYEKGYERLTESVDKMRENNEKWYKKAVEERRQKLPESIEKSIEATKRRKKVEIVRNILNEGVFRDSSTVPENQRAIFLAVKQAYLDSMFEVVRPKEGKGYLNNKMFNMQWAIATHASTADKMLNPGNFEPQKRMGYMVAANRLGYSWNELEKMKTKDIKDLVFTSKNLMDFDVQTQFYKQNAVAGQILGIFAVAKSAHAMFEGRNYGILVDSPFSIDGMEFRGAMHYDVKYDRNGVTLVGKHLGSLVGASADAVKDPVLNFMNINKETINVLNTALRLGLDFDTASLLLSSKAVSDVLDTYRRKSLSEKTSFDKEVRKAIRDLEKKEWIGKDSPLKNQDLTKREMVWAITGKIREGNEEKAKQADQIVYKILNAVYQLSQLSQRAQPLTDLSRLNSVTSAPGPLHINTIASDRKLGPEISMDGIIRFKDSYKDIDGNVVNVGELEGEGSYVLGVQVNKTNLHTMLLTGAIERYEDYDTVDREMVFDDVPSLKAFYRSYEIVKQLFKDLGFTTASDSFNKVLAAVPEDIEFSLYNKEKLLSSLADFFQSYILVQSGVVKSSWLKNYAQNFVKEYVKADYKSQERFRNNPFIQAIQPILISKEGEPDRYALKIETTGMEQSEKDALSAGWIQLEKQDPELSHKLFVYNFFRGGIGFNPKTFMGLVPIQVKEKIQGYIEAYSSIPTVNGYDVIDQWVRNNWMNNDLVAPVSLRLNPNAGIVHIEKKYIYNTPTYIRTTVDGNNYLYRLRSREDKSVTYEKIEPLGNNGEYLEMYGTNDAVSPFDHPQRGTLEIQDSDHLEEKVDDPMADQPTVEEQTRELVDFYQAAYDAEGTQEREEASNDESFDKANKDLDITVNKDKFDEILEDFC